MIAGYHAVRARVLLLFCSVSFRGRGMTARFPKHMSAQKIADLRLAGLPSTKRGVAMRAEAEQWNWIERKGRGGGRLFSVKSLPAEARQDLLSRRPANENRNARRGRPAGRNFFTENPEVADAVTGWLAARKLSAAVILQMIQAEFVQTPSLRTLQRFIAQTEDRHALALQSIRDPNAFKGTRRMSLGRADAGITYANQRWEIDTTPGDVLLVEGRRAILGVIDVFSRRVRFLVMPSESAQSVRKLLSATMADWGARPTTLATDQGSGYVNAAVTSALELLDIEHRACPPGSPEKKPYIERVFGTFQRQRAEVLAGYCGHNVAEAQRLRERARKETGKPLIVPEMTEAELQAVLDNWANGPYLQTRHGTLGMSPLQKWQQSPAGAARAPSPDELRIVLSAHVGTRVVGKRGIEWKRGRYWSPALVEYIGRDVMVRRDEDELGELMIFDDAGHFIDIAVNHQRSGMSEEQFALAARRDQEAHMKAARAGLREKQRRFSIEDARDALLRRDAEMAGKLTTLPGRLQDRPSETVRSIRNREEPPARSATELAEIERAATAKPKARPAARPVEEKIAEADGLIAAAHRGEQVDQDRLRWAQAYAEGSEYRTAKVMAAHFGPRPSEANSSSTRNSIGSAG